MSLRFITTAAHAEVIHSLNWSLCESIHTLYHLHWISTRVSY